MMRKGKEEQGRGGVQGVVHGDGSIDLREGEGDVPLPSSLGEDDAGQQLTRIGSEGGDNEGDEERRNS
jgi:hypothetical protein